MRELILIAVFGALGALSRYGLNCIVKVLKIHSFPFATLVANVLGCLLLGGLTELARENLWGTPPIRLALTVGFLGSLTTFSTFANDTFMQVQQGEWLQSALNVLANLLLGLIAIWLGIFAVRWLLTE